MRILVDENVPNQTVQFLRDRGDDVLDIRGTDREGVEDHDLFQLVIEQGRLLLSTDKGFRAGHFACSGQHYGVLVVTLRRPAWRNTHQRFIDGLTLVEPDDWFGRYLRMRDASHRFSPLRGQP